MDGMHLMVTKQRHGTLLKIIIILFLLVMISKNSPQSKLKLSTIMFEIKCEQTGGNFKFEIDTSKVVFEPNYYCDCSGDILLYNPDENFEGCK